MKNILAKTKQNNKTYTSMHGSKKLQNLDNHQTYSWTNHCS